MLSAEQKILNRYVLVWCVNFVRWVIDSRSCDRHTQGVAKVEHRTSPRHVRSHHWLATINLFRCLGHQLHPRRIKVSSIWIYGTKNFDSNVFKSVLVEVFPKFVEYVVRTLFRDESKIHFCLGDCRQNSLETGVLVAGVESSDIRCRLESQLLTKIFTVQASYETRYAKRIEPFRCVVWKCLDCSYRLGSWFRDPIVETFDENVFVGVFDGLQSLKKPPSSRWQYCGVR